MRFSRSNLPWATVEGAMQGFMEILNSTWFREEGDDEDGDEMGQLLLEKIKVPPGHPQAERIRRLREDFFIFVANDHQHPDHPEWRGAYFLSEAQAIWLACSKA